MASLHIYECKECGTFREPEGWDSDPATRCCPFCGVKGVGYLGYSGAVHSVRSDSIMKNSAQGLFNHADGKMYDSRSAYERAVKDKGLVIVGDDAPTQKATPVTKEIDWRPAVAETLKQLSPTKKGKKK